MKRLGISVLLLILGTATPAVAKPDKVPKPPKPPSIEVTDDGEVHELPEPDDEEGEGDDDHGEGSGPSHLKVSGPVSFHFEALTGDIVAIAGGNDVDISSPGCPASQMHLSQSGSEVEAELDNPLSCTGPFMIKVPAASSAEIKAVSGNITLKGKFGDIELEAVSGDISVEKAADVEVNAVNGKVKIGDAAGKVTLETVRGDTDVTMSSSSPRLSYQAVSGSLTWNGTCGAGCRMEIESFSGTVALHFDPRSSFGLKMTSRSGTFKDDLGLKVGTVKHPSEGDQKTRATFGKGEGSVECETFSGGVTVGKR